MRQKHFHDFFSLQNGQEAIKCRVIPVGRVHPEKEYFFYFMSQLNFFSDSIDTYKALVSVYLSTNGKIWIYLRKDTQSKEQETQEEEKERA